MRACLYTGGEAAELPFPEGAQHFGRADLLWLHLDGRESDVRAWLSTQDDIPDVVRSALLAVETRPRCDVIGHGALINMRGLGKTPEDDPDALVSLRFWAEKGRVISLSFRSPLSLDRVVREFLDSKIKDPGDLLTAFATSSTDDLDPEIAALGDALDAIEVNLAGSGIYKIRRDVSALRSQAIHYRRFVVPQRQALEKLATAPVNWLDEHDRMHLHEASDRFSRMAEELEAVRERAAIVHDELTDLHAEQMDGRSLLLSIYALVFLPLTFVTGLFGMNVPIPYTDDPTAFWVITGGCILTVIVGIAWFLSKRWINRDGSVE
ncbi:MAG: zinc transporter ZntB [Sphingomonadaceae bacterium]